MLRRNADIPRQPCNKLIWVVVPSSTVAICFATCDGSQSHTKCKGILGRDCSPPSPVPAHKLASKQAYLSIWFSTLLSFGPHLWFCLSQWCHVLRDCGTILQGASKHITTTLWRVIRHQHDLDSHFAQTSECQASLYIIKCYSMCSCKLACSIIYIYKFTQITQTPGKLLWLPFWNKLPLPVGIEPLKATCFWMTETEKPFDALGSSSNKVSCKIPCKENNLIQLTMFGFLYLSLGICHPLCCHQNATLVTLHKSQDWLFEYFKFKIITGNRNSTIEPFPALTQGPSFTHFTHFDAQSFHLFPLRIFCVHLCFGFVSKDGKRAMWMYDNCNIYGIYDI